MTEKDSFHSVEFRIDRDSVYANLRCAAPEGAKCRMRCPEDCPSWPCDHELIDGGCCNAIDFMEQGYSAVECHVGKDTPVRDGPIVIRWDGDWYEWEYTDV